MITTGICIIAGIFVATMVSLCLSTAGPTKFGFRHPKPGDGDYLYPYHDSH